MLLFIIYISVMVVIIVLELLTREHDSYDSKLIQLSLIWPVFLPFIAVIVLGVIILFIIDAIKYNIDKFLKKT